MEHFIDTVHECLGRPRSDKAVDAMTKDSLSPTGYVGLWKGKVHSHKVTDYGTTYDGQYWHSIDKCLLALARAPGHAPEGLRIAKSCFPAFFNPQGGGIRWKLSVDTTPPPPLQRLTQPNEDTLAVLIVFLLLENQRSNGKDALSLANEIGLLHKHLKGYRPRVTDDPLGWGLEALLTDI